MKHRILKKGKSKRLNQIQHIENNLYTEKKNNIKTSLY